MKRKSKRMAFAIAPAIGGRFGAYSRYSLVEFCVHIVDRYGLKESETATIVTLQVGEKAYIVKEKDEPILGVKRVA